MILHQEINLRIPHHKSQVCISTLVADKPLLAFQAAVKHARNAFEFVGEAGLGGWELFGVEEVEPKSFC